MADDDLLFSTSHLLVGVATAALQIEGGDRNNSWYDWAQLPGTIKDGSSPDRATDHWRRWREDTELMASLGLQVYRMSVEWSRIEPRPGEIDRAALGRYREELTAIRDAGIEPLVSLHHFSHPSWFQGLGEFTSPRSVDLFLSFVRVVVEALGDLVTDWVTHNEPNVHATAGYLFGEGPPARRDLPALRRTLRHKAIAHCRAYHLIHELQPHARVGLAHHLRSFDPLSPLNPLHRAAAYLDQKLFQDVLTDAALGGRFHRLLGPAPEVTPGRHYDFLGINYYSRTAATGFADGTFPGVPVNDLGWEIFPQGLVEVAADLHRRYPGPIWVTENGTADARDAFRSRFIHDHLAAIASSGLPFERYYHWCFVDNWEWTEGEAIRFGIVANDYETQERTVRDSRALPGAGHRRRRGELGGLRGVRRGPGLPGGRPVTAPPEQRAPVSGGWITRYGLLYLGQNTAWAGPSQLLIAIQVAEWFPGQKEERLAWLMAAGGAVMLVATPLAGAVSDRTGSRFGRRTPWILAGALVAALALVVMGFAPGYAVLVAGWLLFQAVLAFSTNARSRWPRTRCRGDSTAWSRASWGSPTPSAW